MRLEQKLIEEKLPVDSVLFLDHHDAPDYTLGVMRDIGVLGENDILLDSFLELHEIVAPRKGISSI